MLMSCKNQNLHQQLEGYNGKMRKKATE